MTRIRGGATYITYTSVYNIHYHTQSRYIHNRLTDLTARVGGDEDEEALARPLPGVEHEDRHMPRLRALNVFFVFFFGGKGCFLLVWKGGEGGEFCGGCGGLFWGG